jgi:hypothetical protein
MQDIDGNLRIATAMYNDGQSSINLHDPRTTSTAQMGFDAQSAPYMKLWVNDENVWNAWPEKAHSRTKKQ